MCIVIAIHDKNTRYSKKASISQDILFRSITGMPKDWRSRHLKANLMIALERNVRKFYEIYVGCQIFDKYEEGLNYTSTLSKYYDQELMNEDIFFGLLHPNASMLSTAPASMFLKLVSILIFRPQIEKQKGGMSTTPEIPRPSPIQVLTRPNVA
uniref:Uncharacterized protein n=1 Tax=Onchocerca volvulus TaxID=6282 RepID=A0A8R1XMR7_ONCVO